MNLDSLKRQGGNLLLLMTGMFFFVGALISLDLGTARRMGPGFFPMALGAILCVLAAVEILAMRKRDERPEKPEYRSVAAIAGGAAAFAFGTPLLGLMPTTFVTVLVAGGADPKLSLRMRALLGVVVAVGVWLIFVVGLKLPFVAIRGVF